MSEKIVCPQCKSAFDRSDPVTWRCSRCGFSVPLLEGKPVFTNFPNDLNPSEKIERNAEQGTLWRQYNWKFIERISNTLPGQVDVLDVGAGRGDFKTLFTRHAYLGLDIYPYPELDLSVDLIEMCPFNDNSFDLVVLANVIEHVYEYRKLVSRCARLLKPGGRVLITVPFLLKLHQEPVDFHRYTRYTLATLAEENQLEVETLDAYTNPLALLDEGIGDTWQYLVKKQTGMRGFTGKARVAVIQRLCNGMKKSFGNGKVKTASTDDDPYVLGYLCEFRKPSPEGRA
ncbi:MAG: methyltransferase domain-containing protein [Chloroflexi bacterium]|nr:methyltransferase domain-containing protein [Chloroflexota bacterium]